MADTKSVLTWLLRDEVSGPAKKIDDTLGKAAKNAGTHTGIFGKLGSAIGGIASPTNLAIGAAAGLATFLVGAAGAAAEEQKNVQKMKAALIAAVPGFDGNTDAIEALISKREDLAFSDDELRASLATLVTSTHDVNEAQDLQATAMDLARLKGVDLATATDALAKANVGSTKELKALGITVDDTKDKTQVFAAIQKAAAGQAEAYAGTAAGKWQTFNNKLGDVVESIGGALLPILDSLVSFADDTLIPAIQGFVDLIGPVFRTAIDLLGPKVKWFLSNVVGPLADGLRNALDILETLLRRLGVLENSPKVAEHLQSIGVSVPGAGSTGGAARASGGPVEAGDTYTVGENGPETLVMGRNSGTIVPNGGGLAPAVVVLQLDGREVARVVDEHLYYRAHASAPSLLRG